VISTAPISNWIEAISIVIGVIRIGPGAIWNWIAMNPTHPGLVAIGIEVISSSDFLSPASRALFFKIHRQPSLERLGYFPFVR